MFLLESPRGQPEGNGVTSLSRKYGPRRVIGFNPLALGAGVGGFTTQIHPYPDLFSACGNVTAVSLDCRYG